MKRRISILLVLCSFFLSGCTVTADRIYTVCRVTDNHVYVYNASGEFFLYNDGKVIPCPNADLQPKPKLVLRLPEDTSFNLEKEMPSVYKGTKEDALAYISRVMQECSAEVTCTECDWKSFTALLRSDTFDMKVFYSTDNHVRIYMNDENGNAVSPLYLD